MISSFCEILSLLPVHTAVVKDHMYNFTTWMTILKQLKQTSLKVRDCLRTFHCEWRRYVSACWVPHNDLCCCRQDAKECEEEWVGKGWICNVFYKREMWFECACTLLAYVPSLSLHETLWSALPGNAWFPVASPV